jgi:hypothetical protein
MCGLQDTQTTLMRLKSRYPARAIRYSLTSGEHHSSPNQMRTECNIGPEKWASIHNQACSQTQDSPPKNWQPVGRSNEQIRRDDSKPGDAPRQEPPVSGSCQRHFTLKAIRNMLQQQSGEYRLLKANELMARFCRL